MTAEQAAGSLRDTAQKFLWEAEAYRTAHYNGTHMTADGTAAWAVREREFEKKAKALRAALAATGDSEGPLDVERLARAIHDQLAGIGFDSRDCQGWMDHIATATDIAEGYARLSSKGYDKADHAAREDAG